MKINVFQVKNEVGNQKAFQFIVRPDELDIDKQQLDIIDHISVAGKIENEGNILDITGTVSADVRQTCGRCLEVFATRISAQFNEKYQYRGFDEEQGDCTSFSGEELDITDIIRESLLLAEPMKMLCRDDCKGFCPECGVNLNDSKCSCMKEAIDPRLAVLQQLLKKQ